VLMRAESHPPAIDPTGPLSEFIANLTYTDLPERVRSRVHLIAADAIANAFAGWQASETMSIKGLAESLGGKGNSTVIGGSRLSSAGAIVLNAYLITAVSACDVYRPALCHVTPEVLPPALCITEQIEASGEQLLLALAAGFETTVRLGQGLHYPVFRSKGWHSPGVIGPFGGAAAVGKLIGLDESHLRNALGLAGSQASGTFATFGTAAVKFHQAHGALAGFTAGLLAAEHFKTTGEILTHPDGGLLNIMSDGGDPAAITAGLGERWELENISLRLWPTAAALQAVISALMTLIQQHDLKPQEVSKIQISLPPASYEMNGTMGWDNRLSARLSARYVTSVVLHDRACWLDQFDNTHLADQGIVDFARSKVEVDRDQSIEGDGAKVVVSTSSGKTLMERRSYAKGDPFDPLTFDDVGKKLKAFGEPLLGSERVSRIYELLYRLESQGNIQPLCASLRNPENDIQT
jgi:2-methylcitrate dehydratase PrpD